jgi:hypothetical protein
MKVDLPFVQPVRARGRMYYYFRRGRTRIALSGRPGSREFQDSYDAALRQNAPHLLQQPKRGAAGRGSLAWVIHRYKARAEAWAEASDSTRAIYDRRQHWLVKNYGSEPIASFDRDAIKMMRDLPEFTDKPSVADATVERLAALWDFAEEFLHLDDMKAHKGINPARKSRS